MSDLSKLKDILDNQAECGIRSGEFVELSYEEETVLHENQWWLYIPSLSAKFIFSKVGRLLGAYNWKE